MSVEVLCGMIASGKSTYAKKRAEEGAVIVNDDSIVIAVHGGNYQLYRSDYKFIYKSVGLEIAKSAILLNKDVVIDCTNRTRDSRRRWIGLATSMDTKVNAVVFKKESDEVHAKRRADADGRGYDYAYWLKVANAHSKDWEWPQENEGFTTINELYYDPSLNVFVPCFYGIS